MKKKLKQSFLSKEIQNCRLSFNTYMNDIVCKSIDSLINMNPVFTENRILLYKVAIEIVIIYACPI